MPRLLPVDPKSATGRTKELLEGVQKMLGVTPNIVRTMANAPAVLEAYLSQGEALSRGSFDARSREAIALTVAGANGCEYCASAHAAISKSLKVDDQEIVSHLGGHASDPKLAAALVFARAVVTKRGFVSDEDVAAMRAAGHDDGAIAEVVANVAANIFTNYFNHVAQAEVDFPVVDASEHRATIPTPSV